MLTDRLVRINSCQTYNHVSVLRCLDDDIFSCVQPGATVVLKPNWVLESHKKKSDCWEHVITHPAVITAVLEKVSKRLQGAGRIFIVDGPMTEASFSKILSHYPVEIWAEDAKNQGLTLEIIDLRDHEWITKDGVTIERRPLQGDPRGKVLVDLLKECSEFNDQKKSKRGYYGADYDIEETNRAHDGLHNLYSVSRSVIEADVFINLPKLKTHKKAGITCCLKNLVGINTYKNFLPHHMEGRVSEGGDQFKNETMSTKIESKLLYFTKEYLLRHESVARYLSPYKKFFKLLLGNSEDVVRNGSWYGNDTIWRMILDLNKVLLYSSIDGVMRDDSPVNVKSYIGIVDAVLAGEGDGPLCPEPLPLGYLVSGHNPVAIDTACALLMGFDPAKIPTILNAYSVDKYKLCDFVMEDVDLILDGSAYSLCDLPSSFIKRFKAQSGWAGYVENDALL